MSASAPPAIDASLKMLISSEAMGLLNITLPLITMEVLSTVSREAV